MRQAVESVKEAGLPAMFAFVYDVFYQGLTCFDAAFKAILGQGYRLVPNLAVYFIEPSEQGKGFAPHRDAEYVQAVDSQGMPTVLTVWITITEANPLNSCLYVLPKHRDPQYLDSIRDLSVTADAFAWEDVRALPTPPGVMSCWTQYLFHWGSRASGRASEPRITYAVYLQSGEVDPVTQQTVVIPAPLSFRERLSLICRSLRHYNYATFASWERSEELLAFLEQHTI
ncbi:phytanoyl-CoA dioxygenase family protein [bacterium]|nr:phytanoyl-CoA dioxygenase family protein [bacterium]